VNDEPELQLTLKEDHSSLIVSKARISLAARGRRDAELLVDEVPGHLLRDLPLWRVRQQAEAGYSNAQDELGDRYSEGRTVPENTVDAATWYQMAAEKGHLSAYFSLGEMYQTGTGVPQSTPDALRCFCAATNDDVDYADWDPDMIHAMWLAAAELGDAKAQYLYAASRVSRATRLGDDHKIGLYAEAAQWYCKAAEQGHLYAQLAVASLYETGEGVSQDLGKASTWFRKAAENGDVIGDGLPRALYELYLTRRL
jgi:hypothetical protein